MQNSALIKSTLAIALLSTVFVSSKATAQNSNLASICADENARNSYGFSAEKCLEYQQQAQENNLVTLKKLLHNANSYRKMDRYMLEAIALEDALPMLESGGYNELYNEADERINMVVNWCNQYSRKVNLSKKNQTYNLITGISQLTQGYEPNHRRNFDDQLQHEMLMQDYNHKCSDLTDY